MGSLFMYFFKFSLGSG